MQCNTTVKLVETLKLPWKGVYSAQRVLKGETFKMDAKMKWIYAWQHLKRSVVFLLTSCKLSWKNIIFYFYFFLFFSFLKINLFNFFQKWRIYCHFEKKIVTKILVFFSFNKINPCDTKQVMNPIAISFANTLVLAKDWVMLWPCMFQSPNIVTS